MSQHDGVIANQQGLAFRADINDLASAILTSMSGPTAPTTTYANMWWADTTANIMKRRNAANSTWIDVMPLAFAFSTFGATLAAVADDKAGRVALGVAPRAARIDIASVAGTVDLTANAPDTDDIQFTGNNAMTGFTVAVGRVFRFVVATSATPSLVSGANIDTQTGANIQLNPGDSGVLRATAANVVELLSLTRATPIGASLYAALGANVLLNNTGTYFDGPSVAQGTSGTWLVMGKASVVDSSTTAHFTLRITDGTTIVDSSYFANPGLGNVASGNVVGIITNPVGNLKLQARDISSTSGTMLYNQSGLGKDCSITAVRIG